MNNEYGPFVLLWFHYMDLAFGLSFCLSIFISIIIIFFFFVRQGHDKKN